MNIPLAAPCPLIIALPVILENIRICGMSLIRRLISSITSCVSARLLPGEVRTSMKTVPISSWGTSPVLVVLIKKKSPLPATTSNTTASHLRLSMKNTPLLYFITTRWKAVSKATWKREEKLIFPPLPVSACGVMISAQRAGLRVMALRREIPTATAIVRPNWV